jgi:hypothetical protein
MQQVTLVAQKPFAPIIPVIFMIIGLILFGVSFIWCCDYYDDYYFWTVQTIAWFFFFIGLILLSALLRWRRRMMLYGALANQNRPVVVVERGQPSTVVYSQQPSYGQPAVAYGQPSVAYAQPSGYQQQSAYGQPSAVYQQ